MQMCCTGRGRSFYGPRKRSGGLEEVERWSRLELYGDVSNMPLMDRRAGDLWLWRLMKRATRNCRGSAERPGLKREKQKERSVVETSRGSLVELRKLRELAEACGTRKCAFVCCSCVKRRDVFQYACDDVIRRERPHRQIPKKNIWGATRKLGGTIFTVGYD